MKKKRQVSDHLQKHTLKLLPSAFFSRATHAHAPHAPPSPAAMQPIAEAAPSASSPRRLLVAVDDTDEAAAALAWALDNLYK